MYRYNLVFLSLLYLGPTIAHDSQNEGPSNQNHSTSDKIGYKPIILAEPNEELHINQTGHHDQKNKHQKIYDDTGGANFTSTHIVQTNTTNLDDIDDSSWIVENKEYIDSRRILYSKPAKHPHMAYMVYLQLNKKSAKINNYKEWLCGGVIIHKYYVLTSAACVEDADHFYVIAGTSKWVNPDHIRRNKCICKNKRRVIWKCTPKRYRFDYRDSQKWAANDLAIVRVETAFNLNVKERYCEYATEIVAYNNISAELEMTGTKGFILGWGSEGGFREGIYRRKTELSFSDKNANELQIAKVIIMDKELCANKWAPKFRDIIRRYMICTKDILKRLTLICDKKHAKCKEVGEDFRKYGRFNETLLKNNGLELRESMVIDNDLVKDIELEDELEDKVVKVDLGRHVRDPDDFSARRMYYGGFCQNDHGGPLVVNYEGQLIVIGLISTCKIHPNKHICHGPFLYTSVFINSNFIACSMYKELIETCRKSYRKGITHDEWNIDWTGVDDADKWTRPGETAEEENEDQDKYVEHKPRSEDRRNRAGETAEEENEEHDKNVENGPRSATHSFQANKEPRENDKSLQEAEAEIETIFKESKASTDKTLNPTHEENIKQAITKKNLDDEDVYDPVDLIKSIFKESTDNTTNVKKENEMKSAVTKEILEDEDVNDPVVTNK